jgi:hypothetical protein
LFTILRNIRFNQIRDALSKSRSVETDAPGSTPEFEDKSSKDPFFLYLAKVRQADVRKAIEELPAVYRDVIDCGGSVRHRHVAAEKGERKAQRTAAALELRDK